MPDACAHPVTWAGRTVCPEPCGAMHDRCRDCGTAVGGGCVWDFEMSPGEFMQGLLAAAFGPVIDDETGDGDA